MADSIGTLLFKDKQLKLILTLSNDTKEWHLDDLAKTAGVTYVHTSRFVSKCEDAGLVATENHGRIKRIFLTKSGKEIALSLSELIAKISQAKAQPVAPQPPPDVILPKPQ